jgi:hypothetical protein
MIKDAIANIARNREVLHFLSCIARFLGHFSGLARYVQVDFRLLNLLDYTRRCARLGRCAPPCITPSLQFCRIPGAPYAVH